MGSYIYVDVLVAFELFEIDAWLLIEELCWLSLSMILR